MASNEQHVSVISQSFREILETFQTFTEIENEMKQ